MVIYPEIQVTPDSPTIKFSQPRDQVDLSKELPRILHAQGWGCGTYFNVQFLNHEKTKLLACARFVVTEEVETLQTSDNQYQPMTKTVFSRRAEQISDWWPSVGVMVMPVPEKRPGEVTYITSTAEAIPQEPKRRGRPPKAEQPLPA